MFCKTVTNGNHEYKQNKHIHIRKIVLNLERKRIKERREKPEISYFIYIYIFFN